MKLSYTVLFLLLFVPIFICGWSLSPPLNNILMQLDAEGTGSIHTLMDHVCSPPANYSASKSLYLKVSVTAELQACPQKVLLIHMDSPSL